MDIRSSEVTEMRIFKCWYFFEEKYRKEAENIRSNLEVASISAESRDQIDRVVRKCDDMQLRAGYGSDAAQ